MMESNEGKVLVDKEVAELADHYINYILSLGFLKNLLDQGADPQKVCFEALRFTKQFVDWHQVAFVTGISQPFGILAAGLNDVWARKNPKIFAHNPDLTHDSKPGESFNAVKAAAAAALELRVHYGEELETAAREITRELHNHGVTHRGQNTPVTWKTVKGWRDEMGVRNHPIANSIFQEITQQAKNLFGKEAELSRLKGFTSGESLTLGARV